MFNFWKKKNVVQPENTENSPENTDEKKPKPKKSVFREWRDALVFAIIAATVLRWGLLSAYTIPTSSMEGTQLVGDFLFVSKIAYGPRTPQTPLCLPLADNRFWGSTSTLSYTTLLQLPSIRLWGYTRVKNNDVVVFGYPADTMQGCTPPPVDMKTHYIKRCIGIAGDKIEVKAGQVFVNDKPAKNPPNMQSEYIIKSKNSIHEDKEDKFKDKFKELYISEFGRSGEDDKVYRAYCTEAQAEALRKMDFVVSVTQFIRPKNESLPSGMSPCNELLPNWQKEFSWNEDFFGPLTIPKRGVKIEINAENLKLYGQTIARYEWHENVKIENQKLYIDYKEIKEYTFKQDYFFMMGDNRHQSFDSRFFGFVPEDHIVGQASFTWLSLDANRTWFGGKIRWGRMFTWIN